MTNPRISFYCRLRDMGRFPLPVYAGATGDVLLTILLTHLGLVFYFGARVPWAYDTEGLCDGTYVVDGSTLPYVLGESIYAPVIMLAGRPDDLPLAGRCALLPES